MCAFCSIKLVLVPQTCFFRRFFLLCVLLVSTVVFLLALGSILLCPVGPDFCPGKGVSFFPLLDNMGCWVRRTSIVSSFVQFSRLLSVKLGAFFLLVTDLGTDYRHESKVTTGKTL